MVRIVVERLLRGLGTLFLILGIAQIPIATPLCYFGGMKPGFEPSVVAATCGRGAFIGLAIGVALFWLSRRVFPDRWRSPSD